MDKRVEQLPSKGDSSGMKVLDGGGNDGDVVDSDAWHAAVTEVFTLPPPNPIGLRSDSARTPSGLLAVLGLS